MGDPLLILLLSGKRKSGKDYISDNLYKLLGEKSCTVIRISEPIKAHYAKVNNLDFHQLMGEHEYKEKYRLDMINWSDEVRKKEPGYFCKAACEKAEPKPLWIVGDVRRKTDIAWFKNEYGEKIKTVRIFADQDARIKRGWIFRKGVDDVASECDLDGYETWDLVINNDDEESFQSGMNDLKKLINTHVK